MKWIIRIAVLLAAVIVALLWFGYSQIGTLIKYGIETAGPPALKVPVTVRKVGISLFGSASVEGLELGNPEGFTGSKSLKFGKAELAIDMSSARSEKVIIKHIHVLDTEIHLETGPDDSNLGQIAKNAYAAASQASSANPSPAPASSAGSSEPAAEPLRLQVDEILVRGAKLTASVGLLPGTSASVTLPEFKITGLGSGPEGVSPAELTAQVLTRITEEAVKAGAGGSLKDLLKGGEIKVDADGLKKGIEGLGKLLK